MPQTWGGERRTWIPQTLESLCPVTFSSVFGDGLLSPGSGQESAVGRDRGAGGSTGSPLFPAAQQIPALSPHRPGAHGQPILASWQGPADGHVASTSCTRGQGKPELDPAHPQGRGTGEARGAKCVSFVANQPQKSHTEHFTANVPDPWQRTASLPSSLWLGRSRPSAEEAGTKGAAGERSMRLSRSRPSASFHPRPRRGHVVGSGGGRAEQRRLGPPELVAGGEGGR